MNQSKIEKAAGIDSTELAEYIMKQETLAARMAMSTLKLCVARFENGAFGLLKASVDECKKEMKG